MHSTMIAADERSRWCSRHREPSGPNEMGRSFVLLGRRVPTKVAAAALLLGVLGILCLASPDFSSGVDRRLETAAAAGGSEEAATMLNPPERLPGKPYASCRDEMHFEIARDKYFATLTNETMPRPFPVDVPPLEYVTQKQCEALSEFGKEPARDGSPRVVVHIEVHQDVPMVKRIIQRMAHGKNHAFVIHLADDVSKNVADELVEYGNGDSPAPMCVIRGGYVTYLSSTDIRILFRSMQWLVDGSPHWDFFVSLSGADFPVMNGPRFSRELRAAGSKTWLSPRVHSNFPAFGERFLKYGMTCQETKEYVGIAGRQFWLKNLVPEIEARKVAPMSSGGIWHRDMVEFLVRDDRARAAYMYFRHHHGAGVEHYWPTIFTLPELRDKLVSRMSCAMFWAPVGRFRGTTSNSFMPMSTWDEFIKPSIDAGVPFIRKFDSRRRRDGPVLDRIEKYADEMYSHDLQKVTSS